MHLRKVNDCRGQSGLLYAPWELTTPARQVAQAVLLQHEAQLVKEAFNKRYEKTQAAKADLVALVEEKAARVTAIERELGLTCSTIATTAALVRHHDSSAVCQGIMACKYGESESFHHAAACAVVSLWASLCLTACSHLCLVSLLLHPSVLSVMTSGATRSPSTCITYVVADRL